MHYYDHIEPVPSAGCAVAMGYFDGVHVGHQLVIGHAVAYAKNHGLDAAVFTFDLPVNSHIKGRRLMTDADKLACAEKLGVQYYLAPSFDEFKDMSPEEFVRDMLAGDYCAKAVFCGDNFTFGKRAAGNVELLRQLCEPLGIEVCIVPMATYQGEVISSSRIRLALTEGRVEDANAMLGTPYCIDFDVVHGQGLGRTLAMPTINQHYPEGFQLPRFGIYITRVYLDGKWWPSATGLGTRPTVNNDPSKVTCETFIPGFEGDLYDKKVLLEFHKYLEPSHKFEGVQQLRDAVMGWADAAMSFDFGDRR